MIENHLSGYLYNELLSESNKKNFTAFQSIAWSLIVDKNTTKNCLAAFQALSFRYLYLYSLFPLKTSILLIPQLSVQHLVYVSLTFFFFHEFFTDMCFFII